MGPRDASIIVGTSAGAGVGAYLRLGLSGADLAAMISNEPLSDAGAELIGRLGPSGRLDKPIGPRNWPKPPHPRLVAPARHPTAEAPARSGARRDVPGRPDPDRELDRGVCAPITGAAWPADPLWICTVRMDDARRVVFGRARRARDRRRDRGRHVRRDPGLLPAGRDRRASSTSTAACTPPRTPTCCARRTSTSCSSRRRCRRRATRRCSTSANRRGVTSGYRLAPGGAAAAPRGHPRRRVPTELRRPGGDGWQGDGQRTQRGRRPRRARDHVAPTRARTTRRPPGGARRVSRRPPGSAWSDREFLKRAGLIAGAVTIGGGGGVLTACSGQVPGAVVRQHAEPQRRRTRRSRPSSS